MNNQPEKKDKNDILKKTTSMNLWMRTFVGGFLVYLAYTIAIDLKGAAQKDLLILGGAAVLFALAGLVIAGWSVYRLVKKDYYDPMLPAEDSAEDSENDSQ